MMFDLPWYVYTYIFKQSFEKQKSMFEWLPLYYLSELEKNS